jgi:predicted RNA binding protein YcfA (HicA-like mRNA interferase family)
VKTDIKEGRTTECIELRNAIRKMMSATEAESMIRTVLRVNALTIERQYRSVKVREVLQRLQDEGWVLRRQRASHRQFYHPSFPERRVTVAGLYAQMSLASERFMKCRTWREQLFPKCATFGAPLFHRAALTLQRVIGALNRALVVHFVEKWPKFD